MQQSRLQLLLSVGLMICISSCIVPFTPELDKEEEFIVISGHISNKAGKYSVSVSHAIPYNEIMERPIEGCIVSIKDNEGTVYRYEERRPGIYEIELDYPFLAVGKAYSIRVNTPSNDEYRSKPDTIFPGPEIDSLYFMVGPAENYEAYVPGLQFYISLRGANDDARSFRWDLTETWEYHSSLTPDEVFDGHSFEPYNRSENRICYMTRKMPAVLSASTVSAPQNQLLEHPLIFVSNQTPRLSHKYSLLVNQQSLSNAAFEYWNHINPIDEEFEGLYETQPYDIRGNIYNTTNPEEEVLGFFFATSSAQKRITVDENLPFSVPPKPCAENIVINDLEFPGNEYPYYLMTFLNQYNDPVTVIMDSKCIDCRRLGGTTEKPEFW